MNVEIKRFPSRVLSIRYSVSKLNMAPGMLWLNDNAPNVCVEFLRADVIRGVGSSFMDISQVWRCKVHAVNWVGRTDGALLDSLRRRPQNFRACWQRLLVRQMLIHWVMLPNLITEYSVSLAASTCFRRTYLTCSGYRYTKCFNQIVYSNWASSSPFRTVYVDTFRALGATARMHSDRWIMDGI